MRLVRYADDFVVMIHGQRDDAEALWAEVGAVLAPMGLRPSEAKTTVCHIDEGFDFLGWRGQRRAGRTRTGDTAHTPSPPRRDLAQRAAAFQGVASRGEPGEGFHFGVNSLVRNATFALYRDFPDPVRQRGAERF